MADNDSGIEQKIRSYLTDQGGSVVDPEGRSITNEMARALEVDTPLRLSVILGQLENDGVITRETRGLRTYRIALASPNDGTDPAPESKPPAANAKAAVEAEAGAKINGKRNRVGVRSRPLRRRSAAEVAEVTEPEPGATDPKSAEPKSAEPVAGTPTVTDPGSDKPDPDNSEPDNPDPGATDRESAAPAQPRVEPGDQPAGRAISLREALATRTDKAAPPNHHRNRASDSSADPERAAPPPPVVDTGDAGADEVEGADQTEGADQAEGAGKAKDQPARRAISLREALATRTETAAPPNCHRDPTGGSSADPGTAPPSPTILGIGPYGTAATGASQADISASFTDESDTDEGRSPWRRLNVPVPEVNTPPSRAIIVVVGVALAALVLIAVITVLMNTGSTHYAPALGTTNSSIDACQVVTADQVTAAFGDNAGPPHIVLGECVYDDATRELIVEVARRDGQSLFTAARSASALTVPGIGDGAFYANGRLWVLKGTSLMQLTLGPVPATTPDPVLLTVAKSAVIHL